MVHQKIANTTYEIESDENPEKTLHSLRKHLFEFFPKDATVPPMIKTYNRPKESPDDHRKFIGISIKLPQTIIIFMHPMQNRGLLLFLQWKLKAG